MEYSCLVWTPDLAEQSALVTVIWCFIGCSLHNTIFHVLAREGFYTGCLLPGSPLPCDWRLILHSLYRTGELDPYGLLPRFFSNRRGPSSVNAVQWVYRSAHLRIQTCCISVGTLLLWEQTLNICCGRSWGTATKNWSWVNASRPLGRVTTEPSHWEPSWREPSWRMVIVSSSGRSEHCLLVWFSDNFLTKHTLALFLRWARWKFADNPSVCHR